MIRDHKLWVIFVASAVFLIIEPAQAQRLSCSTYTRTDTHAPRFIQDYLNRSTGLFVRVCGDGARTQFYGGSSVTKKDDVCRYSDYELNFVDANPQRLSRAAKPPQIYMLVTISACPSPVSTNYTATNGLAQDVVEHLLGAWRNSVSSVVSFDKTIFGLSDTAAIERLRNVVAHGQGSRLSVLSVVKRREFWFWKTYELNVADPGRSDKVYFVTVTSWFNQIYRISNVKAGLY